MTLVQAKDCKLETGNRHFLSSTHPLSTCRHLLRPAPMLPQAAAAAAGVAPSQLLTDFALWEMVRRRPANCTALASCSGCSELFIRSHGQVDCWSMLVVRGVCPQRNEQCRWCGVPQSGLQSAGCCVQCLPVCLACAWHLCSTHTSGLPEPACCCAPCLQAFVDALASFCAGSQLLSLGDPSQQQQQQQGADASQRRRSGLLLDGAACSQAAACLGEPKASTRCGSRSLCTAAGRTSLQPIPEAQSPYLASVLSTNGGAFDVLEHAGESR